MKKILIALTVIGGIFFSFAQSNNDTQRKNDVMIDPIILIGVPALNITYERLINENTGIGINLIKDLDGNSDENFTQISPYYRMYFGKKYAAGFFVEAFVPITTTKTLIYNYYYDDNFMYVGESIESKAKTTVGIGFAGGGKWITKKNIIFEASLGLGRRFGLNDNEYDYYGEVVPRGMLGIGYRF